MGVVVPIDGGNEAKASVKPLVELTSQDMILVNKLILSKTGSEVTMIPEVAQHLIDSGGKRLRPMLTLAAARMCGYGDDASATRDLVHRDIRDHQSAKHKQHDLDDVRQRDGLESAVDRVTRGKCRQQPERVVDVEPGHRVDSQRSEPQDGGQVDEDVNAEPEQPEYRLDPGIGLRC